MKKVASVLVKSFGGYDCLEVTDHPLKELEDNEVKVEVHYCGVNFADLYTRQGLMPREKFPFVLGIECSGIITQIGSEVKKFKVGTRVICYDYNGGLYRDVVILSADKCFTIPDYVSLKEAAGIFVNFLTAHFSLFELGNLQSNQNLFVHSCAGGVGLAVTQLSRTQSNVTILGTCSSAKKPTASKYGVQHVLPYLNYHENIQTICPEGVSLFIDNQADGPWQENVPLLKPFGKLVVIGANYYVENDENISDKLNSNQEISMTTLVMNSVSVCGLHLGIICEKQPLYVQETLNKLYLLLKENKIEIIIDSIWNLENIVDATKVLQERRNVGKILLKTKNVFEENNI